MDRKPKGTASTENQFLGELKSDQMPITYASSRALIYPSRYESFGLPLLKL